MSGIMVDTRMKSKIEHMEEFECSCNVKFVDMDDTYWFTTKEDLQEFMNNQSVERFYDKSLRKGYFDYTNEHGEKFRYHVKAYRGKLTLVNEEFIGE